MNVRIRRLSRPIGILSGCIVLVAVLAGVWRVLWIEREDSFCSALWSAAKEGQNDEVETLLKDGHDPNCQHGEALRRARLAGHEDTVAILKRYGAKE
jgi:hypothetical protein